MKITLVAGARPNFMKIAPILRAIEGAASRGEDIQYRLVHTGQHYDKAMSGSFFEQLGIPEPNVNLECGGGSHAEQTAAIMVAFEKELMAHPCDWVVVVGDVTSTMACSISAKKLHIKVAHVEGGIRSGDITMPEEINRLVTDSITDVFFTTSEVANGNLRKAGVSEESIVFVGNTMIDTLLRHENDFVAPAFWEVESLKKGDYLVMTLHRPSNVDDADQLRSIFEVIDDELKDYKVVFPVHPRTRKNMESFGIKPINVVMAEPLGYFEFNYLVKNAKGVITDSGGITEETTVMGVPCITMRNSTERPETVDIGTNELIGTDPENLRKALKQLLSGQWKKGNIPPMWDGKTAERIVEWFSLNLQK
jgi:UDP-N-acetylglucosamine 2-epimerase (non-hydrolysing)